MGIIETLKMQERREGKIEGRLEGKIEGRHEEALEIARELKKEGLSTEFIARTTKLPIEEIKAL